MLKPNTEYAIDDTYLPKTSGNPRQRGTLRFRTDAEGRVWLEGAGHREDACLTRYYATHSRLREVGTY
jgi:hypothetical protein